MPHKKSVHQPKIQYDGRRHVASHGAHWPVRVILHDTESHDVPDSVADLAGVALFWERQGLGLGSQIGVDKDGESARYVNDREIAYHTFMRNTGSLGIEQIGFAFFDRLTWWVKRTKQMHKVAKWMAFYHKEFGIPLVWDVEHGFSTHAMQSRAFGGTHTDPGIGYPKRRVMKLAKQYAREGW